MKPFTFIDLFAGIGGMRIPFDKLGGKSVFSSEWDVYARQTYRANFGEIPRGDITKQDTKNIPSHDLLLAGFPCQAFSKAGLGQGFMDIRGTMFFEIARILKAKRPKMFLLENVKRLQGHDDGQTLNTILDILRGQDNESFDHIPMSAGAREALSTKLNYHVEYRLLKATDFGLPQQRERLFIVGFDKDYFEPGFKFTWPKSRSRETSLGDILRPNANVPPRYTISNKIWKWHQQRQITQRALGNGFGYSLFNHKSPYANTLRARYAKDGAEILIDQSDIGKNPRMLTPNECRALQGFPIGFIIPVSDTQAYKQFGNAVAVPVVAAIAKQMLKVWDEEGA